jgi:hypothetical protein
MSKAPNALKILSSALAPLASKKNLFGNIFPLYTYRQINAN